MVGHRAKNFENTIKKLRETMSSNQQEHLYHEEQSKLEQADSAKEFETISGYNSLEKEILRKELSPQEEKSEKRIKRAGTER